MTRKRRVQAAVLFVGLSLGAWVGAEPLPKKPAAPGQPAQPAQPVQPALPKADVGKPEKALPVPKNTVAPFIAPWGGPGAGPTAGTWYDGSGAAWEKPPPATIDRNWQRCSPSGLTCTDIPGATSLRYQLLGDDIGHRIRLRETAANGASSTTVTSGSTEPVTAVFKAPLFMQRPSISGKCQVGQTLTVNNGSAVGWPLTMTTTYAWQRCLSDSNPAHQAGAPNCTKVGASSTYTLTDADWGADSVEASVTMSNGHAPDATAPAKGCITIVAR